MRLLLLASILSTITEAASTRGYPGIFDWNIFGHDDRVELTSKLYPWRTIGHFSSGCTGTLVNRNLVLTAAHCVLDARTGIVHENLTFAPNRIDATADVVSSVDWLWWGTNQPDNFRAHDWAIVRLKDNLGDKYGWMGLNTSPRFVFTAVGYSEDVKEGKSATIHTDCRIMEHSGGLLLHNCDNSRGASGGPLFFMEGSQAYIGAIAVAEYRDGGDVSLRLPHYDRARANIAIPASTFVAKLKEITGEP